MNTTKHHRVIREFQDRQTKRSQVNSLPVDFIGSQINPSFASARSRIEIVSGPPPFDDEYFEWLDILISVAEAKGGFVFVELGAGFGRWTVRAFKAASQRHLGFRAALVEGEPVHAKWAREHLLTNGVTNCVVHECVVGITNLPTMFIVEKLDKSFHDAPNDWYGQTVSWFQERGQQTGRLYEGRPLFDSGHGWGMIEVPAKRLEEILEPFQAVDLIDMDIQGTEVDLIEQNIGLLGKKVRRVHIATHGPEIETRIRTTMATAGWFKEWDFPCQSKTETPYGVIDFVDGVQTWRNPQAGPARSILSKIAKLIPWAR